jgi:hypothetical protein
MDDSLVFPALPENYEFSVDNFEPMYLSLLEWKRRFVSMLDLMTSSGIDAVFIPPLAYKKHPRGLISIFMEPIPAGFGENIYNRLKFSEVKKLKTMEDFLSIFYVEVQSLQDHSERSKLLTRSFKKQKKRL